MRAGGDYTSAWRSLLLAWVMLPLLGSLLAACSGPRATAGLIGIELTDGQRELRASVPAGSTVQEALDTIGIEVDELDRIQPAAYTVLTDGSRITITRVDEEFETEEVVIPFERQTLPSDTLSPGETRLIQSGVNGLEEVTLRILIEDGEIISRSAVRRVVIEQPLAEIVMVGTQGSSSDVEIAGRLVYASGGNAWLVRRSSENRTPIVTTGDLDGRVLSLSPDGEWLAFTRSESGSASGTINSLWMTRASDPEFEPIDLDVGNVIHFAEWAPEAGLRVLAFSTVEPRPAAPGWQANNDLQIIRLSANGTVLSHEVVLPANSGGQYGWWGMDFAWTIDGRQLAYARADGVGLLDPRQGTLESLAAIVPLQTRGDWAWVPGIAWAPAGGILFFGQHAPPTGVEAPAESPYFDLAALLPTGQQITLAESTGMFNHPSAAPGAKPDGQDGFQIAYLQALSPLESAVSSYRLTLMDQDGSNRRPLFPPEDEPGLRGDDLQQPPLWSPDASHLALIYQGDLWIVDVSSGRGNRITRSGQVTGLDWAP